MEWSHGTAEGIGFKTRRSQRQTAGHCRPDRQPWARTILSGWLERDGKLGGYFLAAANRLPTASQSMTL